MLKTPDWWYQKDAKGAPWWRSGLWLLSALWFAANTVKRALATPYRSPLFVISIGNLTLGGSGKTPIASEVLRILGTQAIGLSRGHGGRLSGPVLVDPSRHSTQEVGDEPLMLALSHRFVISKDRALGLKFIEGQGTKIVVVDDAHQNIKIAKDLHILVVDGDTSNNCWPFGDGGICPNGPLREPLIEGLKRADLCILWMPDLESQPSRDLLGLLSQKPVFIARLKAAPPVVPKRVLGFAGIAKPWKFQATLKSLGYSVVDFMPFPDHKDFESADLDHLTDRAFGLGAELITTQKDWMRLPPIWKNKVGFLPISAQFDDEAGFREALKRAISTS